MHRPLSVLNGLTPYEVLNGNLPDENSFATELILSRKPRIVTKRKVCGVCE